MRLASIPALGSLTLLLLASVAGCATSVPASDTFRARADALVGRPQHDAYLAFGAPTRTTDDGAGGRIVRWEWTRRTPEASTQPITVLPQNPALNPAGIVLVTNEPPHAATRYVEVFVRPDGTVYHTRHDARTPAEDRAHRNRLLLLSAGVLTGLVVGGSVFSALTF